MRTFRALSALLACPTADLQGAIPAIRQVVAAEGVIPLGLALTLAPRLDSLAGDDLHDLEERYVLRFDRSRTLSLNLCKHIHGESRDRGGAMVGLLDTWRAGGFDLTGPELPDDLPVLLEFLSTRPLTEARAILADAGHIPVALAERLSRRESVNTPVLPALVAIARATAVTDEARALLAETDDAPSPDLAAPDATNAEAQVLFGPDPNAGCPVSRDILARMDIPRPPGPARPPPPPPIPQSDPDEASVRHHRQRPGHPGRHHRHRGTEPPRPEGQARHGPAGRRPGAGPAPPSTLRRWTATGWTRRR